MPAPNDKDFRLMSKVAQISQIGMEMAVPVGLGVGLDFWLKTMPWFTIIGTILGPTLGFIHLLALINPPKEDETETKP
ncbi:MAG TPA: AtpZ/AtpI family protein [Gemmatales bacterium]|nr:AtpZ/AtpI family protein [Gemmatales bacterium]